jgi:hypothetical protein
VLEGKIINPNSGLQEDPVPGPDNDPHDPFQSLGLGTIPWFVVMGNHDALIVGTLPHNSSNNYSIFTGDPTRDSISPIDLGRVNPPRCNPIPVDEAPLPGRCVPTPPSQLTTGSLPPDQARAHLTKSTWFDLVAKAGGLPVGHGIPAPVIQSGIGNYTVDPVPGVPIRFIVLDTAATSGAEGAFSDNAIESFLVPALRQAQDDGVLVVVASHHPTDRIAGTKAKLLQTFNSFPNVVLHLNGHGHRNQVIARPGVTPIHGYWEVQTCSLIEWPQQGRLVELVDNRDGTAELWLTLFDLDTDHQPLGALVEGARFMALQEIHAGNLTDGKEREGGVSDRNVILPVVLPSEVRQKLAQLPGKPIESLLFA